MNNQIWWEAPNAVRIPIGILVALALGFRIYAVYRRAKDTSKRSPKVGRTERLIAITLWSFIAVGIVILLITRH